MYYVFQTEFTSFRGRDVIIDSLPLLSACEPHWWLAQPFLKKPSRFEVFTKRGYPLMDNLNVSSSIDVYSIKLIEIINYFNVKYELIDASLKYRKPEELISDSAYKCFHLLEIENAIDIELSKLKISDSGNSISRISELILDYKVLSDEPAMFRLGKAIDLVLVSENLKNAMEKAKITGCKFTPVNKWWS